MQRKFVNPLYKDVIEFLETTAETSGTYLRLQVTLAAGGSNPPHFHKAFSEQFTAVTGVLGVRLKEGTKFLNPGETYTVPKNEVHNFFNPGKEVIVFEINFKPGHEGMEKCFQIAYGLAADGLTNKKGMPKSIYAAALILDLSNTYPAGFMSLFSPLIFWLAQRARKKGIEEKLLEKYGAPAKSSSAISSLVNSLK